MEGNKDSAAASSSSSFVNDLFGPKENPDTQIINDAIFRPAYKLRGESLNSSEFQNNGSETQSSKPEKAVAGVEGQSQGTTSKDKGPYYQEENAHQQFHFHYSSSIYYGGPDLYIPPQPAPSPYFTTLNKDGGEDEPGYASRGNWWLGSLYY